MSEEKLEMEEGQGAVEETAVATAEDQPKPDIGDEFQELGRQLTKATKAVLASPEAKELGAQLQRGLESLEKAVNQLVGQARETKVGKRVESSVSEAATTVKDRGVLDTMAETVASALHTVNKTLEQASEKIQAHAEEAQAEKAAPQQIEVVDTEDEPASDTGSGSGEE